MNATKTWQVCVELEATGAIDKDMLTQLERLLDDTAGIDKAVASLIDRGTGISIAATVVLTSDGIGHAVDQANLAVITTCHRADIPVGDMRETTICPADLDPRA